MSWARLAKKLFADRWSCLALMYFVTAAASLDRRSRDGKDASAVLLFPKAVGVWSSKNIRGGLSAGKN